MKGKAARFAAAPYLLWMVIFTIVPLLLILYFALTTPEGKFTIDNISAVGRYSDVIFKSIWLAAVATAVCLVLSYPLAYIVSRKNGRQQKITLMLVMLPMWMSFLLRTFAWMSILENTGLLNRILGYFGIGPIPMINTPGAVVLGMVYNYLPFMILPLHSIMEKIDNSVIEAAQDLGASPLKVFLRVVLPLTVPGITSGITMVFVPAVSTFIISRMLGGGANLMIGDLIDMQFLGSTYNPNLGSAISLVLMVIIILCMSVMNQFDDEEGKEAMIL